MLPHRLIWNSLPDYVVEADSLNAFKNRLDQYWTNQYVVYDYKSDLKGTGGQRGIPAPVTSHWIGLHSGSILHTRQNYFRLLSSESENRKFCC